jgi:hypothetical protein
MSTARPIAAITALALLGAMGIQSRSAAPAVERHTWIVQAASPAALHAQLALVGARVEQELPIIHAASARLTAAQAARLQREGAVRLYEDRGVRTAGDLLSGVDSLLKSTTNTTNSTLSSSLVGTVTATTTTQVLQPVLSSSLTSTVTEPLVYSISSSTSLQDGTGVNALGLTYETNYPNLIDADRLQDAGITGKGVAIAMLDTGLWQDTTQNYGGRILASYDVLNGGAVRGDPYGHGTQSTSPATTRASRRVRTWCWCAPSTSTARPATAT